SFTPPFVGLLSFTTTCFCSDESPPGTSCGFLPNAALCSSNAFENSVSDSRLQGIVTNESSYHSHELNWIPPPLIISASSQFGIKPTDRPLTRPYFND